MPSAEELDERSGYDAGFLGAAIAAPVAGPAIEADTATTNTGRRVLTYLHYSVATSMRYRLLRWAAWNIDGPSSKKVDRTTFHRDPRLESNAQVGPELYVHNDLDQGHIARLKDVSWGDLDEAWQAGDDSMYYPNITPQMNDFNQAARHGTWGALEDAVLSFLAESRLPRRISLFGGPVLSESDPIYRDSTIPTQFWKMIVYPGDGSICARGFVLKQVVRPLTADPFDKFGVFAHTIDEVQELTGLQFAQPLTDMFDAGIEGVAEAAPGAPIPFAAQVRWS